MAGERRAVASSCARQAPIVSSQPVFSGRKVSGRADSGTWSAIRRMQRARLSLETAGDPLRGRSGQLAGATNSSCGPVRRVPRSCRGTLPRSRRVDRRQPSHPAAASSEAVARLVRADRGRTPRIFDQKGRIEVSRRTWAPQRVDKVIAACCWPARLTLRVPSVVSGRPRRDVQRRSRRIPLCAVSAQSSWR